MLNAISNLFFGAKMPAVEEPVEYNTQEDNEWLLVNVADGKNEPEAQPKAIESKDVNQWEVKTNKRKAKKQKDAKTIENRAPKVNDKPLDELDDILTSVPCLMPLDKSDAGFVDVKYYHHEDNWVVANILQKRVGESDPLRTVPFRQMVLNEVFYGSRGTIASCGFLNSFTKVDLRDCHGGEPTSIIYVQRDPKHTIPDHRDVNHVMTPDRRKKSAKTSAPYSVKTKSERVDKRQHHPAALSGAFVNHQSPVHYSKAELLQQIKVLKPAQSAKDFEGKKFLKKLQLNRHNKAYLYESSNKNQHRRDLMWQRHSGANNNRKCC